MKRLITGAIAGVLIGTFASVVMDTSPAYADNHAVIKQRIELMRKGVLDNFKVIMAFAKDGKGSMADVAAAAKGIKASAEKLLPLFPKGTGRPDYSDKETRSLATIWEDWATFEKANNAMATHAVAIAKHAAANNADGVKASFGMMGKEGCGGCHKPFRGPKAK